MRLIKTTIAAVTALALTGSQLLQAAAPPPPGAANGMVVSAHRLASQAGDRKSVV